VDDVVAAVGCESSCRPHHQRIVDFEQVVLALASLPVIWVTSGVAGPRSASFALAAEQSPRSPAVAKGEHYLLRSRQSLVVPVDKKIRSLTAANDVNPRLRFRPSA